MVMIEQPTGWTRLSSDVEFASEWFEVRRDNVVRPDGSDAVYDHVRAPSAVTVLAVRDDGAVAVTRQWIYVHGEAQWRLPAGGIDPADDDPAAAAARELAEETGVRAGRWQPLGVVHCADSFTDHRDHAFLATDLTEGRSRLGAGEADLVVHWLPAGRLLEMVLAGEVPHAGSTFAVLTARVRNLL